jgi:hypothetical protein
MLLLQDSRRDWFLLSLARDIWRYRQTTKLSLPRDSGGWIALKMVSALRHLISLILEKFHEMMTELWCCFENYSLCLETIRWWMLGLIQVSTSRHTEDCSHGNKVLMTQDSSLRLGWLICHWSIIGLNEMHWKLRVVVSTSRLWQVVFEVEALAPGDQEDLGGSISRLWHCQGELTWWSLMTNCLA